MMEGQNKFEQYQSHERTCPGHFVCSHLLLLYRGTAAEGFLRTNPIQKIAVHWVSSTQKIIYRLIKHGGFSGARFVD